MAIIETYSRAITTEKFGFHGTIETIIYDDADAKCTARGPHDEILGVYFSDEEAWTAITRNRQGRPIPASTYDATDIRWQAK